MRTRSSFRDSQIAWNTNDKCDLVAFRYMLSCVMSNEQFHAAKGSDSFLTTACDFGSGTYADFIAVFHLYRYSIFVC